MADTKMARTKKKTKGLTEKQKRKIILENITKQFGDEAVVDWTGKVDVDVISTQCLSLDMATGIGGFPKGRIVEVYGPEASGKTTLALQVAAEAQRNNGIVAYIDAEHAVDKKYAENLGVDLEKTFFSQPSSAENALELVEGYVRQELLDLVILDSVAALVPQREIEGEMGDSHMGLQARLMSQAMRKLVGIIGKSNTCVVFINQLRSTMSTFGNAPKETTTGGRALKFYSSLRLDIRRIGMVDKRENLYGKEIPNGNKTRVKVVKNRLAPPFEECEFDIIYGEGISKELDVLDLAIKYGVIQKNGSWYAFETIRLGQGRASVKSVLEQDVDLFKVIEDLVKDRINPPEVKEEDE